MPELVSNSWWALLMVGIVAGILSASLGVGSGIVFVPALVILLAVPQKSAQGMSLAVMVPMALLGAFLYWRDPAVEVSIPIVLLLAVGAVVGVLIGRPLAAHLPAHWLRRAFAVFMVIVAVRMFIVTPTRQAPPAGTASQPRTAATQQESESND